MDFILSVQSGLTLEALNVWIATPFRWTLAHSTMINSSAFSLLSTGIEGCCTRILAEVLNTGLTVRTFRVRLAFSNLDCKKL